MKTLVVFSLYAPPTLESQKTGLAKFLCLKLSASCNELESSIMNDSEKKQSLAIAENYFRSNKYQFAEDILNTIIKIDPNNSKANELLAYIYGNRGHLNDSLRFLRKATESNNCSPESLYYLGSSLLKIQAHDEALKAIRKSLDKAGDYFEGLLCAGIACSRLGKNNEALNYYKTAFNFNKNSPELYFNIASIYDELENFNDAIINYDQSINLDPSNYQAWLNKGVCLKKIGALEEALAHFNQAINLQPHYFKAWGNKGALLNEMRKFQEALECYEYALKLNSDYVEALSNKGLTLNLLRQSKSAINVLDKAIKLNPKYADAWLNKAIVLNDLKQFEEAIQCCDEAIRLDPNQSNTYYNKALINLSNKKFELGFKDYEYRFKKINFSFPLDLNRVPIWDGKKINSHILVISEQGLGDEIFYSRFLDEHAKDNKITAIVDKRLVNIFSRSFPLVEFITKDQPLKESAFDFQIAMASLARFTKENAFNILRINKNLLLSNSLLPNKLKNIKQIPCGISWKSANKEIGEAKSISLITLKNILNISKLEFVNLQYGDVKAEIEEVSKQSRAPVQQINDLDLFNDIDGLLSLIGSCRLIITTCNLTAHLAGSIGKKTLLLVPYSRGKIWYWHDEKNSFWYPSIKQYFQDSDLTWNNAISEIVKELEREIA